MKYKPIIHRRLLRVWHVHGDGEHGDLYGDEVRDELEGDHGDDDEYAQVDVLQGDGRGRGGV